MAKRIPVVGDWYQDAVEDVIFEVVAVDEKSRTIEVQYEDGSVNEFDLETWRQMVLLSAQAPEDWRLSYEVGDDDSLNPESMFKADSLDDPLTALEADAGYENEDLD